MNIDQAVDAHAPCSRKVFDSEVHSTDVGKVVQFGAPHNHCLFLQEPRSQHGDDNQLEDLAPQNAGR
jgi:hypothetical protein